MLVDVIFVLFIPHSFKENASLECGAYRINKESSVDWHYEIAVQFAVFALFIQ